MVKLTVTSRFVPAANTPPAGWLTTMPTCPLPAEAALAMTERPAGAVALLKLNSVGS